MTLAEIKRELMAISKRRENRIKEQAQLDYSLAMTIISGVGTILSGKGQMPKLYQVYPSLFEDTDSIARFIQFANQHNHKMEGNK